MKSAHEREYNSVSTSVTVVSFSNSPSRSFMYENSIEKYSCRWWIHQGSAFLMVNTGLCFLKHPNPEGTLSTWLINVYICTHEGAHMRVHTWACTHERAHMRGPNTNDSAGRWNVLRTNAATESDIAACHGLLCFLYVTLRLQLLIKYSKANN